METYRIITEDNRTYPMGLTVTKDRIHAATANEADTCSLVLFRRDEEEPCYVIPMPREQQIGDVWNLSVEGLDFPELFYCFKVDNQLVPDPYGTSFVGWEHWGEAENVTKILKSPVIDEAFNWEGDRPLSLPYEDLVIYRAHMRGFTRHGSSKVSDKGTFRGMTEKIPYLKELGITTLELMPIVEFQEVMMPEGIEGHPYGTLKPTGRINYWGYTKAYYFAPKASFSSGKAKEPVRELKTLVKELHRAGLELVTELYFDGTESPAFVLDVVRFWVREYHVDGIHLVGFPPKELLGRDAYLSRTKLFFTSWDGVDRGRRKHLAEYNDGFLVDMRRLLKGDEDQMSSLVLHTRQNPARCGVVNYMAHTNGFTLMDMVSYDRKHNEANGEGDQDGSCYNYSWNCGVEGPSRRKKVVQLRKKQLRNAILLLMLSQGTPLLLSGDEFGKSKSGNNNTYCQDNELSWLNWNQLRTNADFYEFVKYSIAFRKKHPVFHMAQEPKVMDYKACGCPDLSYHGVNAWRPEFENYRRQMGILYCGEYGTRSDGRKDDSFFVVYNMHWEPHEFALPNLLHKKKWHMAFNTDDGEVNGIYKEGEEPLLENQKKILVPSRTILVIIGK